MTQREQIQKEIDVLQKKLDKTPKTEIEVLRDRVAELEKELMLEKMNKREVIYPYIPPTIYPQVWWGDTTTTVSTF